MLSTERRRRLLDEITTNGRLVTSDAAARLGVSEVTIRSDLDELERRGRVTRTHGGAVIQDSPARIVDFDARMSMHNDAKRRIALAAREYVRANQTVIFDAGTTVMHLAQVLPELSNLTVYTPGITTAQQLLNMEGVDVRLMGGRLNGRWLETIGTPQEQGIEDLVAHTLFLGAQGVDSDLDIVDQSTELVAGKLHYARRARFIVFLADSSKWNNAALSKVMPLSRANVVITDDGIDAAVRTRLEASDIDVVIA